MSIIFVEVEMRRQNRMAADFDDTSKSILFGGTEL